MAYQKLQVGRATAVATITSDTENTLNLNDPITLTSDALTAGTTGSTLIAAAATFITDGITAGDLVVNTTTTPQASRVISVDSETQITVQTTGLFTSADDIQIWTQSKEPAIIYVGTQAGGQAITVTTAGGDDITFTDPIQGSFLPVQCVRVWSSSTATNIIALW